MDAEDGLTMEAEDAAEKVASAPAVRAGAKAVARHSRQEPKPSAISWLYRNTRGEPDSRGFYDVSVRQFM